MRVRPMFFLVAALCGAPLVTASAQQPLAAPFAGPMHVAPAADRDTTAPVQPLGPRVADPAAIGSAIVAPADVAAPSPRAYRSNQTITVSTLALVLGVIIIVLLVR